MQSELKGFAGLRLGGWGEIRTHGELAPTAVFKTAALNHSATHPNQASMRVWFVPRWLHPDALPPDCYHCSAERFCMARFSAASTRAAASHPQLVVAVLDALAKAREPAPRPVLVLFRVQHGRAGMCGSRSMRAGRSRSSPGFGRHGRASARRPRARSLQTSTASGHQRGGPPYQVRHLGYA